ncbi:hypothetical protein QBC41DRAFT_320099 [Cercophora samala]|uniref:Uncharacterized protein n=1 Tax=Cercophora samala TaxID=330535 RepID=A0AA39ZF36_9PEZI|nr:hypothetical protein QBC41DRAFT_320099 [Cercophora samala]
MAHHSKRSHNNRLVVNGTAIVNHPSSMGLAGVKPAQRPASISHIQPAHNITTSSCSKSKIAAKRQHHESSLSNSHITTSAKALIPLLSSLSSLAVHKTSLKKSRLSFDHQTLSSATTKLLYKRVRNHQRATYSYLLKRNQWKRTHRRVALRKMSSLNHLSLPVADEPLSTQETINHPSPSSTSSSRSTSPSDSSSSRQQSESVTSVSSVASSQKSTDGKLEEIKERVESKVAVKVETASLSTQGTETAVITTSDIKINPAKRKHEETEADPTPQPKKVVKTIRLVIKKPAAATLPPPSAVGAATDEPPPISGARSSPPPPMTTAVAKPTTKIILKRPSSTAPPAMTPAAGNSGDHKEPAKQKKLDKGKRKLIEQDDDDDEEAIPAPKRARYTKNTYEGPEKPVQKMEYFERRRHEMLDDPLGYDDLVRHTNQQPSALTKKKFLRWERHYRHPKPEKFEMSGALNPPDMTSALAGSGKKKGEESLSRSARKRAHRKRAEEEANALRREKSRERTTSGGETEGEEKLTGKGKGVARIEKGKDTSIGYHKQQQQRKKSAGRQYNGGSD